MPIAAIQVENLGKRYRIGTRAHHDTLRDAVASTFRHAQRAKLRHPQTCPPSADTLWALKNLSFDVAPGNGLVRLQRVWVESKDRSQGPDLIPREAPLSIGVEYQQLDASVQLHVTFQLYVEQQTIAFASASSQDRHWADWAQRTGPIRCVCTIPANLLNTGQHRVRLRVVRDRNSTCLVREDALAFDVVQTNERTGARFGKMAGAVRPTLSWQIEPLDQSGEHRSS